MFKEACQGIQLYLEEEMIRKSLLVSLLFSMHAAYGTEPGEFVKESKIFPDIGQLETKILFNRDASEGFEKNFFQVTAPTDNPPRIILEGDGLLRSYGDQGDFGLLVYNNEVTDFILKIRVKTPDGYFKYANSGIYLKFQDPRDLNAVNIPADVLDRAINRTPGFIADWSGYEVQILSGVIEGEPEIKTNGAFYNIPEGTLPGTQKRVEFKLNPSDTYDVIVRVKGNQFDAYMKWEGSEEYLHVSSFENDQSDRGTNGFIGFQSYYTNGDSIKTIRYESISLTELK